MASRKPPPRSPILSPELKLSLGKWVIGGVVSFVAAYGAWKSYLWPDIRDTWRLEATAQKKDAEVDQRIKDHEAGDKQNAKELSEKIDAKSKSISEQVSTLATQADQRSSWIAAGVSGVNASVQGLIFDNCMKDNKGRADACRQADQALKSAIQDAANAKSAAQSKSAPQPKGGN